jgi:hypothetical protein
VREEPWGLSASCWNTKRAGVASRRGCLPGLQWRGSTGVHTLTVVGFSSLLPCLLPSRCTSGKAVGRGRPCHASHACACSPSLDQPPALDLVDGQTLRLLFPEGIIHGPLMGDGSFTLALYLLGYPAHATVGSQYFIEG